MAEGNSRTIAIVVVGALAVVALLVQSERRMARLESKLDRIAVAPDTEAASAGHAARRDGGTADAGDAQAANFVPGSAYGAAPPPPRPATARMPQAQAFLAATKLDEPTWTALLAANRRWVAALKKAQASTAPDRFAELDKASQAHTLHLLAVLTKIDQGMAKYQGFEAGVPGTIKVRSPEGREFAGVDFE